MRCLAFGRLAATLALFAVSACAQQPPLRTFALFFNDFSSTIGPEGAQIVASAASAARFFPAGSVRVTGYADNAGSTQADIDLSRARADAVATLLQQDGVASSRIVRAAVGTPPNSQPGVERRRVEIDVDTP